MATVLTVAGLVFLALGLVFAEFFVPSFGALTLTACAAYATALVVAHRSGPILFWATIGATAPLLALDIYVALKLWRRSPLVLRARAPAGSGEGDLSPLVGKEGVALTDLRPSGAVLVEDSRHDATCRRGWLKRGSRVRVDSVRGGRLVVEPIREPGRAE